MMTLPPLPPLPPSAVRCLILARPRQKVAEPLPPLPAWTLMTSLSMNLASLGLVGSWRAFVWR